MGNKWYAGGLYFSCRRCGRCCTGAPGYVWLKKGEGERIAAFLGIDPKEFFARYTRRVNGRCSLTERSNGDCVFFSREISGCTVYPVRPAQCRSYPFWKGILMRKRFWDKAAESCSGMNSGAFYDEAAIERMLKLYEEEEED